MGKRYCNPQVGYAITPDGRMLLSTTVTGVIPGTYVIISTSVVAELGELLDTLFAPYDLIETGRGATWVEFWISDIWTA